MKRIISIFVLIAIMISSMCIPAFSEVVSIPDYTQNPEVAFRENFDKCIFDMPAGWTNNNYAKKNSWVQADYAMTGNAYFLRDDTESDAGVLTSPEFNVTPGKVYTMSVAVYCPSGSVAVYLRFFDAQDKALYSSYTQITVNGNWENIGASAIAPEGAVYAKVLLATAVSTKGIGYFDDIVVYKGVYKVDTPIKLNPPLQADSVKAQIIEPVDNKLKYNSYTEYGDKLGDYSYSGFYNGEYELPDSSKLPVAAVVEPSSDPTLDDTQRIQDIIDEVYNNSPDDWFKVIKLKAGRYNIGKQGLHMKSGIILSGEGQGPDGTILYAYTPTPHRALYAVGANPTKISEEANILDDYVESGSYEITIEESRIGDYQVGDLINVHHHCTEEWAKAMGMDRIINSTNEITSWSEGLLNMDMERTIIKIEGNKLTLDLPFYVPMQMKESKPYIYKIDDSARLQHIGVENLRVESYYNGTPHDENHGQTAIEFSNVKNSFVRDVSAKYFYYSAVTFTYGAKQVSAVNCSSLEPISTVAGSRRYAFRGQGSQQLFTGCYSYNGRHDYVTSDSVTGPIVFADSVVDSSNSVSENHCLWTTGTLYDNILGVSNGYKEYLGFTNCGLWGTVSSGTHGWSAGSTVAWNCLFSAITGSKPPLTYNNFMVGQWGYYDDELAESRRTANIGFKQSIYRTSAQIGAKPENYYRPEGSSFAGDCYMESPTAPVEPRSMYRAQLAERLTGDYRNTKPGAPVITAPRGETTQKNNKITFEGLYLKGADKVTLYIDNKAYDAKLDSKNNMFFLTVNLEDGTHKIHATQTVDGIESTKCADRFIIVNKSNGNPSYLQSNYEFDKINPLINSSRIPFDEYQEKMQSEGTNKISLVVNGRVLKPDVDPIIVNDRVMVTVRAMFEALETSLEFDEKTSTATGKRDGLIIKITNNSKTAYVNENPVELDSPAIIVDGRFLVPARFISESLGADVSWNNIRKTVNVEGGVCIYKPSHDIPDEIGVFWATQSADDGAGNSIPNLFDGTKSGWSCAADNPDGSYGIFDFGSVRELKNIHIQFYAGAQRIYSFDLFVSDDGVNYTQVGEKYVSSGKTTDMEVFPVNAKGRYLKLVGYGNQLNTWNNFMEMAFTGR